MEELVIQTHSFETSKNQLKKFSEETTTDLDLKKVDSDKGVGEFFGDLFLGRGIGLDHMVTGPELNRLTTQIQTHLININNMQRSFIQEFGQVYTALEALDKDYIQAILIAVKSAQKANSEAKIAQGDIEKTIEEQKKIIKVLQQFKEKLDKYKHIVDIDKMWGELQAFQSEFAPYKKSADGLNQFRSRLDKLKHLNDLDKLWTDTQSQHKSITELTESIKEISASVDANEKNVVTLLEMKETLDALQHLSDIDLLWNYVTEGNKSIEQLLADVNALIEKTTKQENELISISKTVTQISNQNHIYEIDDMWNALDETRDTIVPLSTQTQGIVKSLAEQTESVSRITERMGEYDKIAHLFDIDSLFKDYQLLLNEVEELKADKEQKDIAINEITENLNEEKSKLTEIESKVSSKLKIAYIMTGGAVGLAVIELILMIMRLI